MTNVSFTRIVLLLVMRLLLFLVMLLLLVLLVSLAPFVLIRAIGCDVFGASTIEAPSLLVGGVLPLGEFVSFSFL